MNGKDTGRAVPSDGSAERNVLITGATTGIGYELSKCFAADGFNLVLVARNEELLVQRREELSASYGVKVKLFALDLTEAAVPQRIFEDLQNENIPIEVLVNNAGFGLVGAFADNEPEIERRMIRLNIEALTMLSKLFLREMLSREKGRILNVASTAAFLPGPLMAVYYASKNHVLAFSRALASELRGSGVKVSVLCPGPTATQFQKTARQEGAKVLKISLMDAGTVARAAYRGLWKGKQVIIPGLLNKLTFVASRLFPDRLLMPFVKNLHRKS